MDEKRKRDPSDYSVDEILAETKSAAMGPEDPKGPVPEKPSAPQPSQPEITIPTKPEMPMPPVHNGEIRMEEAKKQGFFARRRRKKEETDEADIYEGLDLTQPLHIPTAEEEKTERTSQQQEVEKKAARERLGPTRAFAYLFDDTAEEDLDEEIAVRFQEIHKERQQTIELEMKKSGIREDEDIFRIYDNQETNVRAGDKNRERELASFSRKGQEEKSGGTPKKKENELPLFKRGYLDESVFSEEPSPSRVAKEEKPSKKKPEAKGIPDNASGKQKRELTPQSMESAKRKDNSAEQNTIELLLQEISNAVVRPPVPGKKAPPVITFGTPPKPSKEEEQKNREKEELKEKKRLIRVLMNAAPQYPTAHLPVHNLSGEGIHAAFEQEARFYKTEEKEESPPVLPHPSVKKRPEEKKEDPKKDLEERKVQENLDDFTLPKPENLPLPIVEEVQDEIRFKGEPIIPEPEPEDEFPEEEGGMDFQITGDQEEENDPEDEFPEEPEEIDDYSNPEDAAAVFLEIEENLKKLVIRLIVTGVSFLLLLLISVLCEFQILPASVPAEAGGLTLAICNLCFTLVAGGFCAVPIWNGLQGLFRLHANSDTAAAVAMVAVVIQSVAAFFVRDSLVGGGVHLYSVLAVGILLFNTMGKLSMLRRVHKNFRFVSKDEEHSAVCVYEDHNMALQMAKDCVIQTPVIAYQKKTKFFTGFLRRSYQPDPSEQTSQVIAPIAVLASLALCAVCVFLTRDAVSAITVFAAAACISAPVTNLLSVNMPVAQICKLARRCGSMLVGYPAIEHFCNVNAVMLDAEELFPSGTVVLNGIKTFGGQRIDGAITDAAALMHAVGGPMDSMFQKIIQNQTQMMPKVESTDYEDEKGIIGWVAGRRILIGGRALLAAHGIEPPSQDYEDKYLLGGKSVVYLASGGDLIAMFIISYNSDKRRALELQRMEENGISLIVRNCDANITAPFLAQCFGISEHSIRVLPKRLGEIYETLVKEPEESVPALAATKGKAVSMMRIMVACVRQKGNLSLALALQMVAIILGFVLVAFLACYSGLQQLSTAALLIYEAFWVLAILLIPRIRKP